MAKDCPKCRLVNPAEAQRCDCGYDFQVKAMRTSYLAVQGRKDSQTKDEFPGPEFGVDTLGKLGDILGLFGT